MRRGPDPVTSDSDVNSGRGKENNESVFAEERSMGEAGEDCRARGRGNGGERKHIYPKVTTLLIVLVSNIKNQLMARKLFFFFFWDNYRG